MNIQSFFEQAIQMKASDLHLVSGSVPTTRVNGEMFRLSNVVLEEAEMEEAVTKLLDEKRMHKFKKNRELDFSEEFSGSRFRINLHFQEGKIGMTARLIPSDIPRPEELGLTETIYKLTHLQDGLILVTGPSGSGKSTTMASMLNIINKERKAHIITIEDPIEYYFKEDQSIIEQRELGTDTKGFAEALRSALRQDPNVIMVGEMRDLETINAALVAAETGHLVISTLHTYTAAETIERIVSIFPAYQQNEILNQLASVLRAVIAQSLIPSKSGKLVAAREIMINNSAIASMIRRNQIGQIPSVIQTSKKEGMITMNKAIDQLLENNMITYDIASHRKRNLETQAAYF